MEADLFLQDQAILKTKARMVKIWEVTIEVQTQALQVWNHLATQAKWNLPASHQANLEETATDISEEAITRKTKVHSPVQDQSTLAPDLFLQEPDQSKLEPDLSPLEPGSLITPISQVNLDPSLLALVFSTSKVAI